MLRKLLAGLLVAAAVLAMVEGGMRLVLGPPPPPVAVFAVNGDLERYLTFAEGEASAVYQNYEPIPPFSVDAPAVAVLGGSSVHVGQGSLETSQEFPALLEGRLGLPVYNLGSPGLDSFDLVRITEELEAVSLRALVVYTGHNDLGNVLFQQRYGDMVGTLSARMLPILEQLQMFSQLRRTLQPPSGTEHPDRPASIRRNKDLRPSQAQRDLAVRFFTANIERIVWLCQRRKVPLILVVPASNLMASPAPDHCKPNVPCAKGLWRRGVKATEGRRPQEALGLLQQARDIDPISVRASSDIEAAMRSFSLESGVTVVDAAADLPRMTDNLVPQRHLFRDAIHFSIAGHEALADLLEEPVRQALTPSP